MIKRQSKHLKIHSVTTMFALVATLFSSIGHTQTPLSTAISAEQDNSSNKQSPPQTTNLRQALSITDLTIEMAESTWKVRPTLQSLSELVNALEKNLNSRCFGDMLRKLSYEGPPTDPDCLARMERLLDLYPGNPVATCLRDGIESQSCSDAYRGQSMKSFSSSWSPEETPDPALRVGLSRQDQEKLRAINETLLSINKDYQQSKTNMEKQKATDDAMHLYDQALSIACKIVALRLEDPTAGQRQPHEDPAVREVKEKLRKIPPALRAEYQNKLLSEAEEELAKAKNSPSKRKIILEKIAAINNPGIDALPTTKGKIRYRVVLPECFELVGKASVLLPKLPSPTCHRDGWQSPQCFRAVQRWHTYKAEVAARKLQAEERARPTPGSQIASF